MFKLDVEISDSEPISVVDIEIADDKYSYIDDGRTRLRCASREVAGIDIDCVVMGCYLSIRYIRGRFFCTRVCASIEFITSLEQV
jgi:hypothetical protein